MFHLLNKKKIFRLSIISAVVFSIITTAIAFIVNQTQNSRAITEDGAQVNIFKKDGVPTIYYHDWHTNLYQVSIGDKTFDAYCAEPANGDPEGSTSATQVNSSDEWSNVIRLIDYIRKNNNTLTQSLRNQVFSGIDITDWGYDIAHGYRESLSLDLKEYAFAHAIIGAIKDDWSGLSEEAARQVSNAISLLRDAISSNSRAWQVVENNQLYKARVAGPASDGRQRQEVVWVEDNQVLGKIEFQKMDGNSTTAQSGLSFAGITVKVYNNSGREVYDPTKDEFRANGAEMASGKTDDKGRITFENLPALNVTYSIKETATNNYYQLNPNAVSATLTPSNTTANVSISNEPNLGKIVVTKVDSDTGTCKPSGNASLVGTKFELYNNTGQKITYGNKTYENGEMMDDETIQSASDTSCQVTFDNVPLGRYIVKEIASNSYNVVTASQNVNLNSNSVTISFANTSAKGKITVKKVDANSNTCTPQGNATFNGTKFRIINNSNNSIYYGNNEIKKGEVIATKDLDLNNACSAVFENLPYGEYIVEEIAVGTGYNRNTEAKTVTIPTNNNMNVTTTFANTPIKGKVTVNKVDANTNTCTPQGNATFNGTKFRIKNNSNNSIYYGNNEIKKGEVIATKDLNLENNACSAVFENLPYGKYIVEEIAVGTGYNRNTEAKTVTIPTDNNINITTSYANSVIIGKLTVHIIDEDTGSCVNTRGLTFNGAKYTVVNKSANPIYYDGKIIPVNGTIEDKTYANDNCSITIDDLPIGDYEVKQTGVTEGYTIDSNTYTPSITIENLHPEETLINKPIRGDVKFIKMDATNNKPLRDVIFSISAIDDDYNIIESHIFITNQDGVLDTSSEFALHTNNTNGYDPLYDEVDPLSFLGYGTWFGTDELGNPIRTVDNERALPYGRYIIQELRCGSNLFCSGVLNQKITIRINSANQVIDLGDWDNACVNFELETTAKDPEDDDKFVKVSKEAKIVDTIDYCVKPNTDFTIKGVLMDKATGKPVLINDEPVESSIKLRSETDCGQTEMTFTFDASELGGKELVVFETLYYKDDIITKHDDINDDSQTIEIVSAYTFATNDATGEKVLPLDQDVVVKDVVKYCLKPGEEYVIKGVLMNKSTGNGVLANSEPVEAEKTITPTEACGETELFFEFNTKGLGGTDLVAFESVYRDDELVVEHHDINDPAQTVSVVPPVPETGFITRILNDGGNTEHIIFIASGVILVGVGGYFASRYFAKKKFYKKF